MASVLICCLQSCKDVHQPGRLRFQYIVNHSKHTTMKVYYLLLAFIGAALSSYSQQAFPIYDSVHGNNISVCPTLHGELWRMLKREHEVCMYKPEGYAPIGRSANMWLSGYDEQGLLHVAAKLYSFGDEGNDYWPGALQGADSIDYNTSAKWAKLWRITRADVQDYLALGVHTVANTPTTILDWPGRGNSYATDAAGQPLLISSDMAPFKDLNGNGRYEPLLGEYPEFNGDEAVWLVYNDNGPVHSSTNGRPLGVQIRLMVYGYKRGTLIDNVVYYSYTIDNKSTNNYNNCSVALCDLADVFGGSSGARYGAVLDSAKRMEIVYNKVARSYASYDSFTRGMTFIEMPGDGAEGLKPIESFLYFNSDVSIMGIPQNDVEVNRYMNGRMRNGDSILINGVQTKIISTVSEGGVTIAEACMDKQFSPSAFFVTTGSKFDFKAGGTTNVTIALLVAAKGGVCGRIDDAHIRAVCDTAWAVYKRPTEMANDSMSSVAFDWSVFPNPAQSQTTISIKGVLPSDAEWMLLTVDGKVLQRGLINRRITTIELGQLPVAPYALRLKVGGDFYTKLLMIN